ncbi:MAG: GHKL domain-containing protein [Melioribacteraceae bacterium]|nr:GHKL domain-containing protein [Melioribacteraceae bacterium]
MKTLILYILFCTSIFSQTNIDSLKEVLTSLNKKAKVNALNVLSRHYFNIARLDSARFYSRAILKYADESNSDSIKALGYLGIAAPFIVEEKFDSASIYLSLALPFAEKLGKKNLLGRIYANTGVVYGRQGQFKKAIESVQKSLEIFQENKDTLQMAVGNGNIAYEYFNMGYYQTSSEYILKSVELSEKINDMIGLGFMHRQMGNNLEGMGSLDKANEQYNLALGIFQKEKDNAEIANTYSEIARIYIKKNEVESAIEVLKKASKIFNKYNLEYGKTLVAKAYSQVYIKKGEYLTAGGFEIAARDYYKKNDFKSELVSSYLRLAQINCNLKNFRAAKKMITQAEQLLNSLTSLTLWEEFFKIKSEYYSKTYNYRLAYENHKKLLAIKDSILSSKISSQINDLQIKYQSEKKQRENDLLIAQNEIQKKEVLEQKLIRNFIIAFLVGFLIFMTLLIRRYRATYKLTQELNHSNATLNKFFSIISHDLKNLFSGQLSYTDLLVSDINNLSQDELHQHLKTIQGSLKNSFRFTENLFSWSMSQQGKIEYISEEIFIETIIDEVISLLQNNAESKKIMLVKNLSVNFSFIADSETIKTVLRNIVNNAIKFTNENGFIKISADKTESSVVISVEDNGIGIDPENIPYLFSIEKNISTKGTANEKGTGLGLILCREFIEKNKGTISVESEPGIGSKFIISIPV